MVLGACSAWSLITAAAGNGRPEGVLCALWRSPRATPVVLSAGAALTAVAAVAAVGNALSFTAVSVGAGLLAGLATARPLTLGAPERPTDTPVRGTRRTP